MLSGRNWWAFHRCLLPPSSGMIRSKECHEQSNRHERVVNCITILVGYLKGRIYLGDLDVDVRTSLKFILVWTAFVGIKAGSSGGILWTRRRTFGLHKGLVTPLIFGRVLLLKHCSNGVSILKQLPIVKSLGYIKFDLQVSSCICRKTNFQCLCYLEVSWSHVTLFWRML
jgi:hypothetical protein